MRDIQTVKKIGIWEDRLLEVFETQMDPELAVTQSDFQGSIMAIVMNTLMLESKKVKDFPKRVRNNLSPH